jgi:hypothetical protein
MASHRADIDDATRAFLLEQRVFFVATAPLSGGGRVNLSPKGLDGTLVVLSPTQVAFLDVGGSGNETSAHLLENGRITLMFCGFGAKPGVVRLFGRGRVVTPGDADWPSGYGRFAPFPGARQVVVVDVERVGSSCGYGVPEMEATTERAILRPRRASRGGAWYCSDSNLESIDGLPTHLGRARGLASPKP